LIDINGNIIKEGMIIEHHYKNGVPHVKGEVIYVEKGLYKGWCIQITELWNKYVQKNENDWDRSYVGGWEKVDFKNPFIMKEENIYKIIG